MKKNLFEHPVVLLGLIACLIFSAYSFALSSSFKTLDDDFCIVRNDDIRSFANTGKILTSSFFGGGYYYRPLVFLSYMVEYHFFGLNAFYYYLTNIFLHVASTIVVFFIVRRMFRRQILMALGVALLFGIHPIHWEAVSNIPGRAILLCAFFSLAAFLAFLAAQEKKKFYAVSWILFGLALLSKESAAMFPLAILTYQWFLGKRAGGGNLKILLPALPFFIIDGIYVLVRCFLKFTSLFVWRNALETFLGFATFLRSVITDMRLFVFPVDLQFDRSVQLFNSLLDKELIATVAFFIVFVAFVSKFWKNFSAEAKFFFTWAWIELLPVSQVVASIGVGPGYISAAEHFLYMPSVGVFVLWALLARGIYQKNVQRRLVSKSFLWILAGVIYGFFFLSTIQNNIYSSNEIAMFERTLALNPENVRIQTSLALSYAKVNRFKEAEVHFRKAVAVDPWNVRARVGLGKAICDQGRLWEGIREYEKIQDPGDQRKLLKENLFATYRILVNKYEKALFTDEDNPQIHYSLAVVYSQLGETQKAIAEYTKTLDLRPDSREALFNLASIYEATGELPKAAELYERMLRLNFTEKDALARYATVHLGQIYQKLNDIEKAKKYNGVTETFKMSTGAQGHTTQERK